MHYIYIKSLSKADLIRIETHNSPPEWIPEALQEINEINYYLIHLNQL